MLGGGRVSVVMGLVGGGGASRVKAKDFNLGERLLQPDCLLSGASEKRKQVGWGEAT